MITQISDDMIRSSITRAVQDVFKTMLHHDVVFAGVSSTLNPDNLHGNRGPEPEPRDDEDGSEKDEAPQRAPNESDGATEGELRHDSPATPPASTGRVDRRSHAAIANDTRSMRMP